MGAAVNTSFKRHVGAAHVPSSEDGRHKVVSYDAAQPDIPRAELAYWDSKDTDEEELPREALSRILRGLLDELPEPHRTCVNVYFFETRGVGGDVKQGVDSGFREAARRIGVNPNTGKPIDKKTVQKYVTLGVQMLRDSIDELPAWQKDVVARALVDGTLQSEVTLEAPPIPTGFPGGLREQS